MPAYDFRCSACEKTFEVIRPASDRSAVCCPDCGAEANRVFTPVGVVFKGSGFHNTDYKPRPKDDSGPSEKPSCPKAGSEGGCSSCPAAS